mgnify:CR=1 FL=1
MEIHIGDRVAEIELVSKEDNKVVLTIDGKPFEADVVMAENGTCNIPVSYTHLTLPTILLV